MVNASLVAIEFDSMLPKGETPRDTEGYEGFYHLLNMEGECALAKLHYIIRDHDAEKFNQRKEIMKQITAAVSYTHLQNRCTDTHLCYFFTVFGQNIVPKHSDFSNCHNLFSPLPATFYLMTPVDCSLLCIGIMSSL